MLSKASKSVKKNNNRRKSRELAMKSVYRGIVNQFDLKQIKKIFLMIQTLFMRMKNSIT